MGVSKNRGVSPQIIHFNRVFHYFHHPFWGSSIFGSTPKYWINEWSIPSKAIEWDSSIFMKMFFLPNEEHEILLCTHVGSYTLSHTHIYLQLLTFTSINVAYQNRNLLDSRRNFPPSPSISLVSKNGGSSKTVGPSLPGNVLRRKYTWQRWA